MKTNLSRVHALIAQAGGNIFRLMEEARRPLEINGPDFVIQVLESTTDADINGFVERIGDKKARIMDSLQKCRDLLEYGFYLRKKLDAANRSSGVMDKLLELNNIKRKLGHLYEVRKLISMSCSQGLQEMKPADYYKASFTDKQRVYSLPVRMFSDTDYAAIQTEIDSTEKESLNLSNEIAFINQTTVIDVLSLEEFQKQ